ncbi:MAG: hypothetical protein ABFS10_07930 [Bacteroidota bacterium]
MRATDITILTDRRYAEPCEESPYTRNVLLEDQLVREALEKRGIRVERCSWDDPGVAWSETGCILFRSTWDYFDRFAEFSTWLERVREQTRMINPYGVIRWNLDKHYLQDLSHEGIHIPPTLFIEKGDPATLTAWTERGGWREVILKPVVSGAARHTYRFRPGDAGEYEKMYRQLIDSESMMIQEFQEQVPSQGEISFMVFGGEFSHAVIKRAKPGDFRVQDDFGGTVDHYEPAGEEVAFAESVVGRCGYQPVYARVDAIWDNEGRMALSELELIEPELWFRFHPGAADHLAAAIEEALY